MRKYTSVNRWVAAKRSGGIAALVAAGIMTSPASADVMSWVGYQYGDGAGGWRSAASWFHGDQWFGYVVPSIDDIAVLDTDFDPQNNGMPRDIYFGDYTVGADAPWVPNEFTVPGGDVNLDRLVVRRGDFTFNFMSSAGTPQGSLTTEAQMHIADVGLAEASLTLVGGRLTTGFVTHIASGEGSKGLVSVEGPRAEWVHNSYLDLGWVGHGTLRVSEGASAVVLHSILAGIRDGSVGRIEVLDGGSLIAHGPVFVPSGHESSGGSLGELLVSGVGSILNASSQWISVGERDTGRMLVERGGRIECDYGRVGVGHPENCDGAAIITDEGSRWDAQFGIVVGTVTEKTGTELSSLTVRRGGIVSSQILLWLGHSGHIDVSDDGQIIVGQEGESADEPHNRPGTLSIINNGYMECYGNIKGNLLLAGGAKALSAFPVTVSIDGDLEVWEGSELGILVTGPEPDQFDQIHVSGNAMLGGTLLIHFRHDYVPEGTATFEIISTEGAVLCDFDNVLVYGLDASRVKVWSTENAVMVTVVPPGECLGDADGDRVVNFEDVTMVLAHFGASGEPFGPGDVDGNGDVDMSDITVVVARWGHSCE